MVYRIEMTCVKILHPNLATIYFVQLFIVRGIQELLDLALSICFSYLYREATKYFHKWIASDQLSYHYGICFLLLNGVRERERGRERFYINNLKLKNVCSSSQLH